MFRLFNKFYSPDDSATITSDDLKVDTTPKAGDKEDDIKFLGEDDEPEKIDLLNDKSLPKDKSLPVDKPKTKEDDEPEPEEDDELKELVEEIEEPDDEKLELVTPVRRREILKKYPELFKDFPYLERAYYREQKYTELFPTIEDAKIAENKSSTLDRFESDLMKGNVETILGAIQQTDKNSFNKIVDQLMPTLQKLDERAYIHVMGNTIKSAIIAMVAESKKSGNEALQSAASILHQFIFGSSDWKPISNLATPEKPNENDNKLVEREQAFTRKQFESSRDELNHRVNNSLKATIEGNIDPKDSMTEYVKRNAVREATEELQTLIDRDSRFRTILDKLWEDAFKKGFTRESTDRIRSAYVSKAKTLLPTVIKKARNEALRGMGKRVVDDTDTEKDNTNKNSSRPRSSNSGERTSTKGNKEIPKGMSTLEFLSQD